MATNHMPSTELDARFSSPEAAALPWTAGEDALQQAQVYWLTTLRADGRPHVTPLIGIWLDDAFHFCTGPGEQKARNLAADARCAVTTGCNALDAGLDVVIDGEAMRVTDEARLQRLADLYAEKYEGWHFDVRDGAFYGDGGKALVYGVAPTTVHGYGKGETFSQTRWRF